MNLLFHHGLFSLVNIWRYQPMKETVIFLQELYAIFLVAEGFKSQAIRAADRHVLRRAIR